MDVIFIRLGFSRLCTILVVVAVALATSLSAVFFILIAGAVPEHTMVVTVLTTILTSSPLIFVMVAAFWRTDRSRAALAAAEESLREANETLEARVRERTADLERARCEAEEASAAKSQFLANMSHELRTPLNAIIGFSDMLTQRREIFEDVSSERVDDYSHTINGAGKHLLSLVNDLLDLARIECGQTDFSPERLCIDTLTEEAVNFLRHQAEGRGQTIETDIAVGSRFFDADARGMHQILVNLLSNALKFSSEGSAVRLSVTGDAGGTTFAVIDRGIGMSVQESDAAVQPFSRLSEAHIAAGESIGLGLSITNALVTKHGGTLVFESEKDVGTTARAHIPAHLGRAAKPLTLVA